MGILKVPGPVTFTVWSVAGLPLAADELLEIEKSRVAALTSPLSTAVTVIEVLPTLPVCGAEVTARVKPLTLPVAGRLAVEAVVELLEAGLVVVVLESELEQPAMTGRARRATAATSGKFLMERMGRTLPLYGPEQGPVALGDRC